MEQFKDYLASEYQVKDAAAIEMKCTHSMNVKIDKKTSIPMNMHTINVTLKFYDKEMKLLKTGTAKFVNNEIPKSQEKKYVNISPKELNNKFMAVRSEIIKKIMLDYTLKSNEIKSKMSDLKQYAGKEKDSIAVEDEFKGKLVQPADTEIETPKKSKKQYDM